MDSIWVIIILVVVSGLSSWLQKRRQIAEEESQPTQDFPPGPRPRPPQPGQPTPTPSSPRPATSRWEEELRRLLEGEMGEVSPPPPPPRTTPQAPPRLPTAPQPPAPRPPATPRPVVRQPAPAPVAAPRPVSVPVPRTEAPSMAAMETAAPRLASLQQSAQAYGRASQLHEAAAERLRRVEQQTVLHRTAAAAVQHRSRPPEIASAVGLLGNPRSARQAIVASVVLGSPKGFE